MIRVLITDDHAVVRQGLKQILSEQPDMKVLGEASTIPELLDQVRKHKWDVVVLDISMPGRGGLDGLKQLREVQPKLPVLILSIDRKSTRLNSSHSRASRMPSSA